MSAAPPRLVLALTACLLACPGDAPEEPTWQRVHQGLPAALLSVWGTAADDVWAVGADTRDGQGPLVLHFDGAAWTRVVTGEAQGNLWWVFGFDGGPIYMGGEGGMILRNQSGAFTRMTTPGAATVFGIWGAAPDDVWAVGGASDSTGGFAWRLQGDAWVDEPTLPADIPTGAAVWKIFGAGPSDAWLVGSNGVALHWDGAALTPGDTGVGSSLFTVHAAGGRYVAVGSFGAVLTRDPAAGWAEADLGFTIGQNLHGSWIDDQGGLWAVGGQTFSPPYDDGVLLHRGTSMIPGGDL